MVINKKIISAIGSILFLIPLFSLASLKPQKPAVFVASPGSVTLEWSSIDYNGCAGIKIYRSTSNYITTHGAGELVSLSCTTTTYHDTAVVNGTLYYYSLFVYDTSGQYSDPATVSFVAQEPASTPPPPPPAPPVVPPPPPASPTPSPVVPPPTPPPSSSGGGGGGGSSSSGSSSGRSSSSVSSGSTGSPQAKISINLSRGSSNSQVTTLQNFLIQQGLLSAGNDSGYFGPLTETAVKAFQRKYNIVSSGTPASTGYGNVGPKTYSLINTLNTTSTSGGQAGSTTSNASVSAQITALKAQILLLQAQLNKLNGK